MSMKCVHWGMYTAGPALHDSNAFRVLLRLADEADDHGHNAFPSAQTIAKDIGSCVRTVYSKLAYLEQKGLIRRGDQGPAAYLPKRHRPVVWELALDLDTTDKITAALTRETGTPAKIAGLETDAAPADNGRQPVADPPAKTCKRPAGDLQSDLQSDLQATCKHVADDPNKPYNPITPNDSTSTREHTDGRTVQEKRKTRFRSWQPGDKAIATATELRADIDSELEKFRTVVEDTGKYPPIPEKSFIKWLKKGAERGLLDRLPTKHPSDRRPETSEHRHTATCRHVLELMNPLRADYPQNPNGFGPSEEFTADCQTVADHLNAGDSPQQAFDSITHKERTNQ